MPKTYNDLYLATRTALKSAGVEAYALEARLLVAYAVGKTKEEFVRDLRLYTSDENEQKIRALLQRRIAGEPLAYLIGEWEFHGLPITVTPDVLIPRMDTEVLVDAALQVLVGRKMNARILDLSPAAAASAARWRMSCRPRASSWWTSATRRSP